MGGDRLIYNEELYIPTVEMETAEILFNSVLSTPGNKFATADISSFHLNIPLLDPEYMWIPVKLMPAQMKEKYKP